MEGDNNPIQRVVELDDKRVNRIEGVVEDLKSAFYVLREEAGKRTSAIDRLQTSVDRLDEAIRGNGKEGLNSVVARLEDRLDEIPRMIEEKVRSAILNMSLELNTTKIRAITQEEIERAGEKPGGWQEFRKTWLFPVVLMVVSALISAGLTYIVVAAP